MPRWLVEVIQAESCPPPRLAALRHSFQSGTVLETLESGEDNVFYHLTEVTQLEAGEEVEREAEKGDHDQHFQKCSSWYCEESYFAPVILPQHQDLSVLVLSYKWKNFRDFDCHFFVHNWRLLR